MGCLVSSRTITAFLELFSVLICYRPRYQFDSKHVKVPRASKACLSIWWYSAVKMSQQYRIPWPWRRHSDTECHEDCTIMLSWIVFHRVAHTASFVCCIYEASYKNSQIGAGVKGLHCPGRRPECSSQNHAAQLTTYSSSCGDLIPSSGLFGVLPHTDTFT